MRETQAQVKRRRRLEKHKEKLAAKKKKRKSKTPSVDDDDEEGRANSSIADSKGDADADGANKKKKLRNRTNVTEAAPTFGEVAYRPPEFAARPKVKVMPLASTLSSESIEAKDSDEDNEEAVQARMIDLMRARAQLAYKNAKAKRRAASARPSSATIDRVRLLP